MKSRTLLHHRKWAHRCRPLDPARNRGARPGIKRILVPLDFSDCSRAALQYAATLAEPFKASLILLYVAETNPAGSELCPGHLPGLETELRRMARKQFARFKKDLPAGMATQSLVRAGSSDAQILEVANQVKADLIVMAAHSQRSQAGQLGATASRVASRAACPLLLVPVKEVRLPFFL